MNSCESDILNILDCSYASQFRKGIIDPTSTPRAYQLLAAAPINIGFTRAPKHNSFTSQLIKGLKELLEESDGEAFSVAELLDHINSGSVNHPAALWNRLPGFSSWIYLAPVPKQKAETPSQMRTVEPEQGALTLRFSLKKTHLSAKQIESLALHLPQACARADIAVRMIEWVNLERTRTTKVSLRGVVTAMRAANRFKSTISVDRRDQSEPRNERAKRRRSEDSQLSIPSKRKL